MAICSHCGGEMTDGISCLIDPIVIGGKAYAPIRWGQEPLSVAQVRARGLPRLWNPLGGVHHPGCCIERCPACHGQAISCGCQADPDCVYERGRAGRCRAHVLRRVGWR